MIRGFPGTGRVVRRGDGEAEMHVGGQGDMEGEGGEAKVGRERKKR